ncbi:MAG: DNA-directed RNA polymerase subunit beta' [Gemmataceae bacterium]|nr:DNA-directed RNA polymerase subunit beta' [Gemmataceae bacterium]
MNNATSAANANSGAETNYDRINDYSSVRISLANPNDIRGAWSHGEVKKPETINYRTYRPERDGLFCERIFGPEKDWECSCGKYRGMKYKGMVCDKCGVKVTHSRVRRKRMGHINLAAPVVHIWFFKAMPSRLGTLLDMKTNQLEKVIYFQDYVVVDPKDSALKERQVLNEDEYKKARAQYGDTFEAGMGAEAVKRLLERLDLVAISNELRQQLGEEMQRGDAKSQQKVKDLVKRLRVVESLRDSGLGGPANKPEWMVLDCIPVIPPDLRPLVLLDSGNFATSDLNDLYRRIINRNNRLKKLVDLNAPEVIIRNEKRMLQQSVDALFDNGRCKRPVMGTSNRDMIKGKQGRFRENLLGKRVDYSARSVIVVGPELRLHQCGLPKKIALELFQPFIIRRLKDLKHADTIKSAKKMLERKDDQVWDILEEVTKSHPVLLNRAPTLHRMGIQAFEPVLIEGNAIRIHPLVCKGFNADFDGDQMAVHLPLSIEAQVEATVLMMSTNNIFSPANGQPIISPSQDIVMGCYYLTAGRGELGESGEAGEGMTFASTAEVFTAYAQKRLGVHARIRVRMPAGKRFVTEHMVQDRLKMEEDVCKDRDRKLTTVGRVLFNEILDDRMPFYDLALSSKHLQRIIADCYQIMGRRATIELLDRMKVLGFRESTRSGLSFATDDLRTPANKTKVLTDTDKEVAKYQRQFEDGDITERERYNRNIELWTKARDHYLMATSGARGSIDQIRQLAGMRGLMSKPNGTIIETPIKASFKEGLSVLEYFSSTHGARKGLADTALKTADSGYLTRKLADVAQNVVVTMYDCGTTQGITKQALMKGDEVERPLSEILRGRVSRTTIVHPKTEEVLVEENEIFTPEKAREIDKLGEIGLDKVMVRSPTTCVAPLGICRMCYGVDLATGALVEEGMAVGIIAAQSIGEPGTQLTMRTFHIGGVVKREVGESDIKIRKPGKVTFRNIRSVVKKESGVEEVIVLSRNGEVSVIGPKGIALETYSIPYGAVLQVKDGQEVVKDDVVCRWDPHIIPIIAETSGTVHFEDMEEGVTIRRERDESSGTERMVIMEHRGDLHPQIMVRPKGDKGERAVAYLPEKAFIEVSEGDQVQAGTILAKITREVAASQDITGGLPRVTEIFEARRPRDPAVMSQVTGYVKFDEKGKKRNKRVVNVEETDERGERTGKVAQHLIPAGKHLKVHDGDFVKAGDALVYGPLIPHDILAINGEEAVRAYLVREVQNVYRAQRVDIDDKHIEIIVAQMLRKVKVENTGDTGLMSGSVIDKFAFRAVNERLRDCVKVKNQNDSRFEKGKVIPKAQYEEEKTRLEEEGGTPATWERPAPADSSPLLLGITKASVQSESFISAASFQETTKVLTEAALAGKIDYLVGLKENVILGHLIPAGTGFTLHQQAALRVAQVEEGVESAEVTPTKA